MGLLFAAALLLLVTALVLHSAHPKRALAIAGAALASFIIAVGLLVLDRGRHAPPSISPDELALSDLSLTTDNYGAQLFGRVANRSPKRLGTLTLAITYKQCPKDAPCRTLGLERARLFLALAPGQTGGFSVLLTQGALLAESDVSWECRIEAAEADF